MPGENSISILSLTLSAVGTVEAGRFVGFNGARSLAGAAGLGVSRSEAADGEMYTADIIGTSLVLSGAPVLLGAALESDATGRAIPLDAGVARARALQPAAAAGQYIEVLLITH